MSNMLVPPTFPSLLTSKLRESLEPLQDRVCSTRFHCMSYQRRKQELAFETGHGTARWRAWCRLTVLG